MLIKTLGTRWYFHMQKFCENLQS